MYKIKKNKRTSINVNESYIGESIETKIERLYSNNEPIGDSAELIYTERKDGVLPAYDVRTDRWDIALEAMDTVNKSKIAQREQRMQAKEDAKIVKMEPENGKTGGEMKTGDPSQ